MLGKTGLWVAAILFGLTLSTVCPADALGNKIETTHRRIYGPITELDGSSMTLSPDGENPVRGTLDTKRTRVQIEGRDASPGELRQGHMVRAQLGLDEVWDIVIVDRR